MPVISSTTDNVMTIRVAGTLDGSAGDEVLLAARQAVSMGADRVDLDLGGISDFTGDGVVSVLGCREVCAVLPEGLHYRTGCGVGREALLAAYAVSS